MAKFAIFGASGFIGGHLAAALERDGHEVLAIGRGGFPPSGQALGHAVFAIGYTANFREHPVDAVRAHVGVLSDVLESYRFDSFLYLSSTRVYAGAAETREDAALTVRPEWPDHLYNLSKLTGEALCLARPETAIRVARLSNVVGRGDAAVNFLPSLVDEARQSGKLVIRTAASSNKDYVDVDDVCALLIRIALSGQKRIYNVASGANTSNEAVAASIARHLGAGVTFASGALAVTFPSIDISRIRDEFSFSPTPFEASFVRSLGEAARNKGHG